MRNCIHHHPNGKFRALNTFVSARTFGLLLTAIPFIEGFERNGDVTPTTASILTVRPGRSSFHRPTWQPARPSPHMSRFRYCDFESSERPSMKLNAFTSLGLMLFLLSIVFPVSAN